MANLLDSLEAWLDEKRLDGKTNREVFSRIKPKARDLVRFAYICGWTSGKAEGRREGIDLGRKEALQDPDPVKGKAEAE
jgi:hypothetical protein